MDDVVETVVLYVEHTIRASRLAEDTKGVRVVIIDRDGHRPRACEHEVDIPRSVAIREYSSITGRNQLPLLIPRTRERPCIGRE